MPNEYKEELSFGDPFAAKQLIDEISRLVYKKIKSELKFDKTYVAQVVEVNGGLVNIKLEGGDNVITGVKNKSGETLNINDYVYIEAINNSLNNIIVKYKK